MSNSLWEYNFVSNQTLVEKTMLFEAIVFGGRVAPVLATPVIAISVSHSNSEFSH
jgi:hypothetical protein